MDLEDPTPLLSQVYLGCTYREAKVDHPAFQAKILTTTTDDIPTKEKNWSTEVATCNCDMQSHAEECAEKI